MALPLVVDVEGSLLGRESDTSHVALHAQQGYDGCGGQNKGKHDTPAGPRVPPRTDQEEARKENHQTSPLVQKLVVVYSHPNGRQCDYEHQPHLKSGCAAEFPPAQ